jgi:hypothetical protein
VKLKDAEKRLKQEPNNLGLRVQVAGLMREAGRSLEAVELYRSVALAYRDQGRTQQAIAVCRSILEIAPEDAACQGLLAMLQQPSTAAPAATAAAKPLPVAAVTMRGSPMPAAPDVPSLRPITTPPTNQPAASVATARPVTAPRPASASTGPATPRPITNAPPTRPIANPATRPTTRPPPMQRPATASAGRAILGPDLRDPRASEPGRRSSLDETPLPAAIPYHLIDPTSQPNKISSGDIELSDDTRVEERPMGLAHAAPRISGLIADTRGIPSEVDLSAELDTRQRPRIDPAVLDKVAQPPPAVRDALDELTPPPEDAVTDRRDALAPGPRGSDDALTPPPRPSHPALRTSHSSLPRIGPPRTSSRPPVVSIPPKTSSRPPVVAIPPKVSSRPSDPNTTPASHPPSPTPAPVGRLRPRPPGEPGPLPRPGLSKIARDSEDEMTQPRERTDADEE